MNTPIMLVHSLVVKSIYSSSPLNKGAQDLSVDSLQFQFNSVFAFIIIGPKITL